MTPDDPPMVMARCEPSDEEATEVMVPEMVKICESKWRRNPRKHKPGCRRLRSACFHLLKTPRRSSRRCWCAAASYSRPRPRWSKCKYPGSFRWKMPRPDWSHSPRMPRRSNTEPRLAGSKLRPNRAKYRHHNCWTSYRLPRSAWFRRRKKRRKPRANCPNRLPAASKSHLSWPKCKFGRLLMCSKECNPPWPPIWFRRQKKRRKTNIGCRCCFAMSRSRRNWLKSKCIRC